VEDSWNWRQQAKRHGPFHWEPLGLGFDAPPLGECSIFDFPATNPRPLLGWRPATHRGSYCSGARPTNLHPAWGGPAIPFGPRGADHRGGGNTLLLRGKALSDGVRAGFVGWAAGLPPASLIRSLLAKQGRGAGRGRWVPRRRGGFYGCPSSTGFEGRWDSVPPRQPRFTSPRVEVVGGQRTRVVTMARGLALDDPRGSSSGVGGRTREDVTRLSEGGSAQGPTALKTSLRLLGLENGLQELTSRRR